MLSTVCRRLPARTLVCLLPVIVAAPAWGGGGGQNLLLVVNPGDENSLRIAEAYARLRGVPDANILFIAPPTSGGVMASDLTTAQFRDLYVRPIEDHLGARGLTGQIDYIAALGQPYRIRDAGAPADQTVSLGFGLSNATWVASGKPLMDLLLRSQPAYQAYATYARGANAALRHGTVYTSYGQPMQLYMGGMLGWTGFQGNTADEVVRSLAAAADADGSKPAGTVYFEANDDVRSTMREYQWPTAQAKLTERGIAWVQESGTPGATPLGRADVLGAVVGHATPALTNGSTYLAGSWADNATSYGALFTDLTQTKATRFIAGGAAATSGTVAEPTAVWTRFPHAMIHVFTADGSTLGEAYLKSVKVPDMLLSLGDLLAQPYADVPAVALVAGPEPGAAVSGRVTLSASAAVAPSATTAGVRRLELYVDGRLVQTVSGAAATFDLDTRALADGYHELRVVAVNDSAAESQGALVRAVRVENRGRSVASNVAALSVDRDQPAALVLSTTAGDGAVARVEVRQLGRVVAALPGSGGALAVDSRLLAYGENRLVPVAVYADGTEVAGAPITVYREPNLLPGRTPVAPASRQAGLQAEYFYGRGGPTLAASDFAGPPDATLFLDRLQVGVPGRTSLGSGTAAHATSAVDRLALRITGLFDVADDQAGEYRFFFFRSNDAMSLAVDDVVVAEFASTGGEVTDLLGANVFLGPGRHALTVLASNVDTGANPGRFDLALYVRGPDGLTEVVSGSTVYIPEPATLALVGAGILAILWQRSRGTARAATVRSR